MPGDEIFISYSHRDERWLDEIVKTLKPLTRKKKFEIWADTKITAGSEWKKEIDLALARAKVALLLVSRNFLQSEFITEHELAPLLKRPGLSVVWIAVGHSLYQETEIAKYQAANDPSKPLNALTESELDLQLVNIAKKIDALLNSEEVPKARIPETAPTPNIASIGPPGAIEKMKRAMSERALSQGNWKWRKISTLAGKAAISFNEALALLRADPDVELDRTDEGVAIARLWSKDNETDPE